MMNNLKAGKLKHVTNQPLLIEDEEFSGMQMITETPEHVYDIENKNGNDNNDRSRNDNAQNKYNSMVIYGLNKVVSLVYLGF
jgi:hypothetical protein